MDFNYEYKFEIVTRQTVVVKPEDACSGDYWNMYEEREQIDMLKDAALEKLLCRKQIEVVNLVE